jgi:luciferase family oxidoreductase group 1
MRLSILDFCKVTDAAPDPVEAIWATIDLATLADKLGYSRFWLGKHHTRDVAHSCPEVLIPVVAGATQHIRVGSAGVLLRLYSPLKVAKTFRLLNAVFPGRIDLGVARGFVDHAVEQCLLGTAPRQDEDPYDGKVHELLSYLRGNSAVVVNPATVAPPDVWILGSRITSVGIAARLGAAFSLCLFFADEGMDKREIIRRYEDNFCPGAERSRPLHSIAVAGVCAQRERDALAIAASWSGGVRPTVVGAAHACAEKLTELAHVYGTEEVVFLDISPRFETRVESYTLLAETLKLKRNI